MNNEQEHIHVVHDLYLFRLIISLNSLKMNKHQKGSLKKYILILYNSTLDNLNIPLAQKKKFVSLFITSILPLIDNSNNVLSACQVRKNKYGVPL